MDNSCIVAAMTCRNTTTIALIDAAVDSMPMMPTLPAGAPVGVEIGNGTSTDVYVSAIASNGKDFWVSSGVTGATDSGLYVFAGGQTLVAAGDVGKTIHLIGSLSAYNNDTQGEVLPEFQALAVQNLSTA